MVCKEGMSGGRSMGRLTFDLWVWKPTAVDALVYHILYNILHIYYNIIIIYNNI